MCASSHDLCRNFVMVRVQHRICVLGASKLTCCAAAREFWRPYREFLDYLVDLVRVKSDNHKLRVDLQLWQLSTVKNFDRLKVLLGLLNEIRDVINFRENALFGVFVHKCAELSLDKIHFLYALSRCSHLDILDRELRHFLVVNGLELLNQSVALLLQLLYNVRETLSNGLKLAFFKSLQVTDLLVKEGPIGFVHLLGLDHQFAQLKKISTNYLVHFRQLAKVVSIVVAVHALGTHKLIAFLTKVLNHSVRMLLAVHAHRLFVA